MQNYGDGRLVCSASDLANASECLWAQVRRIDRALGFDIEVPKESDVMLVRAGQLGDVHEQKQLAIFKDKFGDGVVEIARPNRDDKTRSMAEQMQELATQTQEALKAKNPVVFQATFFDDDFQGFADFIVLTEDGDYAVYDTKLARKAKITALVQLAAYADQLQKMGLPTSKQVHLILGNMEISSHQLDDILPTYLKRRDDMADLIASRKLNKSSGGQAVAWNDCEYSACGRCAVCEPHIEANDDLLLIAGMRLDQRKKLVASGVKTATDLALTTVGEVPGLNTRTFEVLKAQASVQHESKQNPIGAPPAFKVIKASALAALPEPTDGDIFFDFEGDPLYQEGNKWNLDYLFGWVDQNAKFSALWAHNLAQEKQALIDFANEIRARLKTHPGMHVYHYAAYEQTHLLSIAARHNVEEDFVDDLLRKNVLVDLYPLVRRALIVGSHSYSLKKLEPIFVTDEERGEVANAADSVIEYSNYCSLVDAGDSEAAANKLKQIEDYNAYDCRSTLKLRNWLLGLAAKKGVSLLGPDALFQKKVVEPEPDPLFDNLMALIADTDVAHRTPDQTSVALAAAALDFHRRENKQFWQEHHSRLELPLEEWQDTKDVYLVTNVELVKDWHMEGRQTKPRRILRVCATPAPGSSLKVSAKPFLIYEPELQLGWNVPELGLRSAVAATVDEVEAENVFIIEETRMAEEPEYDFFPSVIAPAPPPQTQGIVAAIKEWVQRLADNYPVFPQDAALDILRLKSGLAEPTKPLSDNAYEQIIESVLDLKSSFLAVQGPPGSGKSFNGGQVIADLVLKHGWRVGIVAQSHATVENLLRKVHESGVPVDQIGKPHQKNETIADLVALPTTKWTPLASAGVPTFLGAHQGAVLGGTTWTFVSTGQVDRDSLDLIVIDEAGQFSLANTIAVSVAARNLLLLGDPQQLPQVTQGTHPEPVDGSALGWLAGDDEVLNPKFGYFLPASFRMNPEVCEVVSRNWYDSKLGSRAPQRNLDGVEPGFHAVHVEHLGNSTESVEEADRVVELVREVISCTWDDGSGYIGALSAARENVIVVAPYNAQVNLLRRKLSQAGFADIPVGTVDKFQGQEAAIAIVSLTASSAEDVPRGLEFLLMPNRLNVAISRAKWAAYLVYSPGLLNFKPTNVENLRLFSKFLTLVGTQENTEK